MASSSDDELDLVSAARTQQRAAAAAATKLAARPSPRQQPSPAAAASPRRDASDSDTDGFDLVAAAKRQSGSTAKPKQAVGVSPRHSRGASAAAATPPRAPKAATPLPASRSSPQLAGSESESDGLDMVALAKRRTPPKPPATRPAAALAAAADAAAASPPPSSGARRQLRQTISLADAAAAPAADEGPAAPWRTETVDVLQPGSSAPPPAFAFPACQQSAAAPAAAAAASPERRGAQAPLADTVVLAEMMGDLKDTLRGDIGRLEAGWQARWQQSADSSAELSSQLEHVQMSSSAASEAVQGRLSALQDELSHQRSRLVAVEQGLQAGGGSPAKPAQLQPIEAAGDEPAKSASAAVQPAAPAAASHGGGQPEQGGAPSVEAIMRRLSALEGRVGAQLSTIEALCCGDGGDGGPRSAPTSPARGWAACPGESPHAGSRSPSRAARAAAVAAAAGGGAYGSDGQSSEVSLPSGTSKLGAAWRAAEDTPVGSPRIASALARPASAGPGYGQPRPPSSAEARRSRREVETQVAATQALIAGIQGQIAALSHTTAEMAACRAAGGASAARRLDQLELADRGATSSVHALERRMHELEDAVQATTRSAAAGRATLSALEWRVDKSSEATLGTIKALEARLDRQRADVATAGTTAALADARASALSAEVARLQRRFHTGFGSPLASPSRGGQFRLY